MTINIIKAGLDVTKLRGTGFKLEVAGKDNMDSKDDQLVKGYNCVDVSNQIIAAQSLLKKANLLILKQHLSHCVKDAVLSDNGEEKIDEIIDLLSKIMDK